MPTLTLTNNGLESAVSVGKDSFTIPRGDSEVTAIIPPEPPTKPDLTADRPEIPEGVTAYQYDTAVKAMNESGGTITLHTTLTEGEISEQKQKQEKAEKETQKVEEDKAAKEKERLKAGKALGDEQMEQERALREAEEKERQEQLIKKHSKQLPPQTVSATPVVPPPKPPAPAPPAKK